MTIVRMGTVKLARKKAVLMMTMSKVTSLVNISWDSEFTKVKWVILIVL